MASFEVLGADGRVLVNDTLKTSVITASGNPVFTGGKVVFDYYGGSAGRPPIPVVWASAGIYCGIIGMDWVNSHWQLTIYSSDQTRNGANQLVNVFVYIYDVMYGSTSSFGLQAMTASGEITFDALKKTLRVIKSNIPYTAPGMGNVIPDAPVQPGGKRYGWIPGIPAISGRYRNDSFAGWLYEVYFGIVAMNSSGQFISSRYFRDSANASFDGGGFDVPGTVAVVDVTNH